MANATITITAHIVWWFKLVCRATVLTLRALRALHLISEDRAIEWAKGFGLFVVRYAVRLR